MSTEMGWKTDSNPVDSGYTTQSDMNKMLKHLHELAKENAGLAFMYVLYVIMPHSLDFQEGQLNREVKIQNDLTQMSNLMKDIQQQFNGCEGETKDEDSAAASQIKKDWKDIVNLANSSDFGSKEMHDINGVMVPMTSFAFELYNTSGSFFQKYETITGSDSSGNLSWSRTDTSMGQDIYDAWKAATEEVSYDNDDDKKNNTKYDGDNGAAVKAFQDAFDNIDTTVSGQQGSVQSEMKYYEQVYQSMEAVEQNADKTVATVQRSANGGMKTTSA